MVFCVSNLLPVIFDVVRTVSSENADDSPLYARVVDLVRASKCLDFMLSVLSTLSVRTLPVAASRLLLPVPEWKLADISSRDSVVIRTLFRTTEASAIELPEGLRALFADVPVVPCPSNTSRLRQLDSANPAVDGFSRESSIDLVARLSSLLHRRMPLDSLPSSRSPDGFPPTPQETFLKHLPVMRLAVNPPGA